VIVISAIFAIPLESKAARTEFHKFIRTYGRSYTPSEYQHRFDVFSANVERAAQLSAASKHATFGVTQFMDLTPEEFKANYLSTAGFPTKHNGPVVTMSDAEIEASANSVDWRTKGVVTPVKNQGQCGSCWSFSTTGNVEGQHALKTGKLVSLSEQNLVDCDHECMTYEGQQSCDDGCNGGLMPNAFTYIMKNNGIDTEDSYPYTAVTGYTCLFNASNVGATISGFNNIASDEKVMAAYCAKNGPISIAADAEIWQYYVGGVLADVPCGTTLDHGILIVGYGTETDSFGFQIDYWIVKNSWGASWGESGYLYIQRGVNMCGLANFPSSSFIN